MLSSLDLTCHLTCYTVPVYISIFHCCCSQWRDIALQSAAMQYRDQILTARCSPGRQPVIALYNRFSFNVYYSWLFWATFLCLNLWIWLMWSAWFSLWKEKWFSQTVFIKKRVFKKTLEWWNIILCIIQNNTIISREPLPVTALCISDKNCELQGVLSWNQVQNHMHTHLHSDSKTIATLSSILHLKLCNQSHSYRILGQKRPLQHLLWSVHHRPATPPRACTLNPRAEIAPRNYSPWETKF